ncbi:probable glutamate receptor [Penaeus indicus]|uniref:probable glutamate receptor n=1 Tax=Penaeus indicus TaxID=29960 RepID=UPI00300CB74E
MKVALTFGFIRCKVSGCKLGSFCRGMENVPHLFSGYILGAACFRSVSFEAQNPSKSKHYNPMEEIAAVVRQALDNLDTSYLVLVTTSRTLPFLEFLISGETGYRLIHNWRFSADVASDVIIWDNKEDNCMGHEFHIVALKYAPYMDYSRDSEHPGSLLQPLDSLDYRILRTLAQVLNFTYSIREPLDGQWGVPKENGNWTGIVGTLQHEMADFSLDLTPTDDRAQVIEFSRVYITEPMIIVSAKPRPLPNYLSLVRPFPVMIWVLLILSVVGNGVMMWLLQRGSASHNSGNSLQISFALLYSWGAVVECPPGDTPKGSSGRIVVAAWLTYCLVMATAYRSSLVAHLTVQAKSAAINAFEDLLDNPGWSWGIMDDGGAISSLMMSSSDPLFRELGARMELHDVQRSMDQVLSTQYGFIVSKFFAVDIIARNYSDRFGNTNAYISRTEYNLFSGLGWGLRKGNPLKSHMDRLKQLLVEAGLVNYWMKEVLRENSRKASARNDLVQSRDNRLVLRVEHLQGAFLLLLVGLAVSCLTFVAEVLRHRALASS